MDHNETGWDLQQALTSMETRIREDVRAVGTLARADALAAQETATAAVLANTSLSGRVANLEEKAKWAEAGFGTGFLAMVGFVWHVVTHRGN